MKSKPSLDNIVGYLRALEFLAKQCKGMPRYRMEKLLLRHGRSWPWQNCDLSAICWKTPRACFENAAKLALERRGYTYCEGLAKGFLPIHHAWCLDCSGNVIDPTWGNLRKIRSGFEPVREYFGIPIKTKFLRAMILTSKMYRGVIDVPPRYPIFTTPPREWKERMR